MKQIKFLALCFLALGIVSCESDEAEIDTREIGGNVVLADRAITVLDQNADLTINLISNGQVTFETVEVVDSEGNILTPATISGETATFSSSALGDFIFGEDNDEPTGSFDIRIDAFLSNGEILSEDFSIAVDHAITLDGPAEIVFMDPTTNEEDEDVVTELEYTVDPFSAPIDDFYLEWKIGEEGTYTVDSDITLDKTESGGVIDFANLDYLDYGVTPGDTLYYRFTATSGALEDQVETSFVIIPQAIGATTTVNLSNDASANQLDLSTGELSAEGSESGDIKFQAPTGFTVIEDSDLQFVEVTEEDFLAIDGLLDARTAFDAGTPTTSVTEVENGDVFVYKVTREEVVYYGIIKIGNVTVVDGTAVSYDIEFAEGSIRE